MKKSILNTTSSLLLMMLLLLNNSSALRAQSNEMISPIAPNTTNISKFTDFPKSNSTGIIPIHIPLHEIKLKDFTLPISLDYLAKGIQVEEVASSTGLGWSLNAGGVIARLVRGLPDDYNKEMAIPIQWGYPEVGILWTGKALSIRGFDDKLTDFNNVENKLRDLSVTHGETPPPFSYQGRNDTEYDLFYINLPNISGKFVFNVYEFANGTNRGIQLIPYQDINISHTFDDKGNISSFIIRDNEGNSYYFESKESVLHDTEHYSWLNGFPNQHGELEVVPSHTRREYTTSWYLTKIVTLSEETIKFSYEGEKVDEYTSKTVYAHPFNKHAWGSRDDLIFYRNLVISGIESDFEQINFHYSDNYRKDIDKSRSLDKITVESKLSGEIVKSLDLFYSYFENKDYKNLPGFVSESRISNEYRLKLDSIHDEKEGKYCFSYIEENKLPNRNAFAQDAWGFYNGQQSNQSLIPSVHYYPRLKGSEQFCFLDFESKLIGHELTKDYSTSGANRDANPQTVAYGMLNKIKYPTGGSVEYEYESNRFHLKGKPFYGGGVRIKSIKKYDTQSTQPVIQQNYKYGSGKLISLPTFNAFSPNFITSDKKDIQIFDQSQVELGKAQGGFVCYDEVTIENGPEDINYGKIVYKYSNPATYGILNDFSEEQFYETPVTNFVTNTGKPLDINRVGYNVFPYPPNPEYSWNRGLLYSETVYDKTNLRVSEKTYKYKNYFPNNKNYPSIVYSLKYFVMTRYETVLYPSSILFTKYKLFTDVTKVLINEEERIYTKDNGILTTETSYTYDSPIHMQRTSLLRDNSKGESFIEKYKYVDDYYCQYEDDQYIITFNPSENLPDVEGPNCLYKKRANKLIEKTSYVNKQGKYYMINSSLNTFKYQNNKALLYKTYEACGSVLSKLQPEYLSNTDYKAHFVKDEMYKEIVSFEKYDSKGNLLHYITKDGVFVTYIWSYNYKYLIAEIKYANLSIVEKAVKEIFNVPNIDALSKMHAPDKDKIIKELRNHTSLKDAHVTTYTYKPLIGMTSSTTPTGVTIYYNYDSCGRLIETYIEEDRVKKVIQSYNYNQRNK